MQPGKPFAASRPAMPLWLGQVVNIGLLKNEKRGERERGRTG